MNLNLQRQSSLIPNVNAVSATIVGCGSVGSHVAEVLAKIGIGKLVLYDDDTVEDHNLANQGFYFSDIGKNKAEAVGRKLIEGCGIECSIITEKYSEGLFSTPIVIAAVDSIDARRLIFEAFILSPEPRVLVDCRMAARFGKVLFLRKDSPETLIEYGKTLHSAENTVHEPCTARSTIFCAYGLAALVGACLASEFREEHVSFSTEIDFTTRRCISISA